MKILTILAATIILSSCNRDSKTAETIGLHRECLIDDLKEEDFSAWTFGSDMQMAFDNRPPDTYWVYQEGRNYNGIWQVRWIERPWDKTKFSAFYARCLIPAAPFFDIDVKKQKQGFKRISLQVFIDASGQALYQGIWVKPQDQPEVERDQSEVLPQPPIYDGATQ